MTKVDFLKDLECFTAGPPSAPSQNSSMDYLNHFIIVLLSMGYIMMIETLQIYIMMD